MYVVLSIAGHKNFTKKGNDLYTNLDIDVFDALLGTKVDVQHFNTVIAVMVPFNTYNPEDVIRVKGKGMQLNNGTHGNLYIKLNYRIIKDLTDEQKELIQKIKDNG